ncbi:MAG TPA: DUF3857 domain-containing protein [Brumimicrobium sp.]|nr:DUF3857 domain-containing protein [Brumimicrobium sp.]
MNTLKNLALLIYLTLLGSGMLSANDQLEHNKYDWKENPELSNYTTNDTNVSLVYLKNFESHELIDVADGLREYILIHKHIKVFTDRGIERYNKLYLPVYDDKAFLIEKARVINSKGEVILLRESDIKEGVDEETKRKFRYFALEGIDAGSEIEYIYMYERSPKINGDLQNIQLSELQLDYDYEMIVPIRLKMAFKIYNDRKEFVRDTSSVIKDRLKSRWFIHYDSIEGLSSERSSAYSAELIYFGYKLTANHATNAKDLFNYGELSKLIYDRYHENINKKDLSFIKKLSRKIHIPDQATDREAIRTIEEFVKSNVRIINASISSEVEMEKLWEGKILSTDRAITLFCELFDHFKIDYQIGLTSNRFKYKFDPAFELWSYADEYIIYFPSIDDYTTPDYYDRLGFFNANYINNFGIFVKRVEIAGDKYGVGNVRFIPKNDYKNSGDTLIVKVDFKEQGFIDTEYDVYHSISGYKAEYIQPYYEQIDDEEDQKNLKESLLTFLDNDGKVKDFEVRNLAASNYGLFPIVSEGKLTSDKFFEKARDNYLFKVGELIGPQMEMYSTAERKLPVEEYFGRHYDRTIIFTIPDGYTVKNLENLNLHEFYKNEEGKVIIEFKSNYTQEGDKITVRVIEYYEDIVFPVEVFNDYQRVINAAADFNKVVVIFDKEK